MLAHLSNLSLEQESKTRKAVVFISLFLILISNVTLSGDMLKLFGLEVEISQQKLIAVSKLALLIALMAFLLSVLETLPRRVSRAKRFWDDRWWRPIQEDIDQFYAEIENRDFDFNPNLEWDELAYLKKMERQKTRMKIAGLTRPVVLITRTVFNYLWPVGLSGVAFFEPTLIFLLVNEGSA